MAAPTHHQRVADLILSDLTIGDHIRFRVTSNSMQPLIKKGDTVVAKMITGKEIKRGDILVIKRIDDFLTHRAVSTTNAGWLTKGDNNILPDPPVKPADIIGRVSLVQQANQTIDIETRKWIFINALLAKLGTFETKAFSHHRYLRLPFRIMIIAVQKLSTIHLDQQQKNQL